MRLEGDIADIKSHLNEVLGDCIIKPIKSDASLRKYFRIIHGNEPYILMDSSRERYSLEPFIQITSLLIMMGLTPPKIINYYEERGFLLLEDLGDKVINQIIRDENKEEIYKKIIDVLIFIRKYDESFLRQNSDFSFCTDFNQFLTQELKIFLDYYVHYNLGQALTNHDQKAFLDCFARELKNLPRFGNYLILADFHVDNLILMDNGKIGLLDYQDALLGSPIYDLVSLLQDARRFVDFGFADKMLMYYAGQTGDDLKQISEHYYLLGVQRNLRILGIFARKAILQKDISYISKFKDVIIKYISYSLDKISSHKLKDIVAKLID